MIAYRAPGETLADRDPPRLSFFQRWRNTIFVSGGYFGVGLPVQIFFTDGAMLIWWVLGGLILAGVTAWVERKKLVPERIRSLERLEWLHNLPKTPDGQHVLVDRAGWNKHFPKNES